jgi:hypothetical protein
MRAATEVRTQPRDYGSDQEVRWCPSCDDYVILMALQGALGGNGDSAADLLVHEETDRTLADMLVEPRPPAFPMRRGVVHCDPAPSSEEAVLGRASATAKPLKINELQVRDRTQTNGELSCRLKGVFMENFGAGSRNFFTIRAQFESSTEPRP